MALPSAKFDVPGRYLNVLGGQASKAVQYALAYMKRNIPVIGPKTVVALADAAATLTAAQLIDNGIFTITPTVGRALTVATGAELAAAYPIKVNGNVPVGESFEFTIVNLAAQVVTLTTAASGTTLVGVATINNVSGTWRVVFDTATTVKIYRL